jgi:hypothetical protein
MENDNKSLMGRVGLYDKKITEVNTRIKALLLKQNQHFF